MTGRNPFLSDFVPRYWYFSFSRETTMGWWRRWPGTYKHVTCFAPLPHLGYWIFIDPLAWKTDVGVVPDVEAERVLMFLARPGTEVVRMPVLSTGAKLPRWGYWCTALASHLVGLSGCALRPDALLRECLRNGGVIVGSEQDAGSHIGPERRAEESPGAPGDGGPEGRKSPGENHAAGSAAADP